MLIKKFQLVGGSEGSGELKKQIIEYMLKKKFQLVGGSEGSRELKNKLLNKF